MTLILHYHPLSSYCWKVLIPLHERQVAFEPHLVDLGDEAARQAHYRRWPLGKLPVLEDGRNGRIVPETSIIIEYLDRRFPLSPPLFPADGKACLEARLLDRLLDQYVSGPMQAIVLDRIRPETRKDPAGVAEARAMLDSAYRVIDARIGDRPWLAGDAFSIADCAAAPALFYAFILLPPDGSLERLTGYFERLVERPSVRRVLSDARPYFSMFPFAQDIPSRFL